MKFITGSKLGYLRRLYKTKPVLAALKAGKHVLENAGWTRGRLAATSSHKELSYIKGVGEVVHPSAGSFCAVGAVHRGVYELVGYPVSTVQHTAAKELDLIVGNIITDYNDNTAKSKKEILKVFDKAIDRENEKK